MPTQGQTPPTAKARVVLHPLKTQKSGSTPEKLSPEMKKRKRAEEEEKEYKQETRLDQEKVEQRRKSGNRQKTSRRKS
jgi:hypothetical protein